MAPESPAPSAEKHSTEQNANRNGVRAVSRPADRIPGEEGIWVFILGDMTIFGILFAAYLWYRGQQPELYAGAQQALNQNYGVINTLLLLTSSLFVVIGVQSLRRRSSAVAPWLFAGALLCGLGFIVAKYFEYSEKVSAGITPGTNEFFMYYYVLTGLHLFHLVIGMCVLVYLILKARRPELTKKQFGYVEGSACYWHMVDLLWIVLFPLLYLVK